MISRVPRASPMILIHRRVLLLLLKVPKAAAAAGAIHRRIGLWRCIFEESGFQASRRSAPVSPTTCQRETRQPARHSTKRRCCALRRTSTSFFRPAGRATSTAPGSTRPERFYFYFMKSRVRTSCRSIQASARSINNGSGTGACMLHGPGTKRIQKTYPASTIRAMCAVSKLVRPT